MAHEPQGLFDLPEAERKHLWVLFMAAAFVIGENSLNTEDCAYLADAACDEYEKRFGFPRG